MGARFGQQKVNSAHHLDRRRQSTSLRQKKTVHIPWTEDSTNHLDKKQSTSHGQKTVHITWTKEDSRHHLVKARERGEGLKYVVTEEMFEREWSIGKPAAKILDSLA